MTDDLVIIDTIKTISLPETFTFISALNVPTPKNKIRIEHNWVAADPFKKSNPGIRISNYRYWNVVGKLQNDFHGTLRFNYDGRTVNGAGYLDNTLISATEDSLVLLYRKSVADDWQVIPHTINFNGSHIDKAGTITTDSIRLGEYALGYYDYTVSIAIPIKKPDYKLTVSPNPGKGEVSVSFAIESARSAEIIICDSNGRQVFATKIFPHQEMIKWDAGNCSIGKYLITLVINGQTAQTEKFILTR
ncbi:MAG: T9SS type A sorting domain-containing protein [Bacteroidetes bacterium]|nr:T9SS type A sorting domain-containing protein [Bacteroidota bacterium]